ncbi:MAG: NAD-dependent epimerase/dehydratase family protein [Ruminiclostridium sp.]|nr:NAD-dependent epimerase/dehydratase family protein [Ruminiclostridium sp.]
MDMDILITGAAGFVGKNLTVALETLRDGKDRTRPGLSVGRIWAYDVDSDPAVLEEACEKADFVFHLAGVNRPRDPADFMKGNVGFSSLLLDMLKAAGNTCPVLLSSSVQATLEGRYAEGEYGKSKRAGEDLFFRYGEETGAQVLVYRFPNLFGKWCRPNYNSAVATFCHQAAHDLPVTVHDRSTQLELVYIDDLLAELLDALEGKPHRDETGVFCRVPVSHQVTLGEVADLLESFRQQPATLRMPSIPGGSFARKLYSAYLTYLPREKLAVPLKMNTDHRGSFTEFLKTDACGQFSVNISRPGITKGQHWHHSKWEFFLVVAGHGLIQERRLGSEDVVEFEVSGDKLEAIHMIPGCTHNIINLSETENLVTLMWANESFDPDHPDTFFEAVT